MIAVDKAQNFFFEIEAIVQINLFHSQYVHPPNIDPEKIFDYAEKHLQNNGKIRKPLDLSAFVAIPVKTSWNSKIKSEHV